jgi:hypothetical protein
MNKVVIREYWDDIIVRITDICVVDDEGDVIEAETIMREKVEVVESGDIKRYVPTEETYPYLMNDYNRFKEEHKNLLNES